MNLDDESYLSAYLDDELDPADRLAIEWSVESSAPLADQLRSIAQARDAVAGLDRPAIPRDLAPLIKARIAPVSRRARLKTLARPAARVALAASAFTGMAASLIFAVILLNRVLHEAPTHPELVKNLDPVPAPRTNTPIPIQSPVPAPKPTEIVSTKPVTPPSRSDSPVAKAEEIATHPPAENRESGYRRLITQMLERPRVRRIVIVTDIQDAPDRVQELIRDDARQTPEFGRISICQDIIIDPDRTEPAEVFAVPMDARVRRSFVDRLREHFPDLIEEGDSNPELVMELSEVGRVAVFRGAEAAPLGDPPGDLRPFIANRADAPRDHIVEPRLGHLDSVLGEGASPIARVGSTEPHEKRVDVADHHSKPTDDEPDFVGPPDLNRMAPPRPGEQLTLLVWVTRPPKR